MKKSTLLAVIAMAVAAMFFTGCKKSDLNGDYPITGVRWVLESIRYSAMNIVPVDEPFWIVFNDDGSLQMRVDCNDCGGSFTVGENNSIAFVQLACTEAFCGEDSKDRQFYDAIDAASRYEAGENNLRIYFVSLENEDGALNFTREE
jgi:heat shock protein HslJ